MVLGAFALFAGQADAQGGPNSPGQPFEQLEAKLDELGAAAASLETKADALEVKADTIDNKADDIEAATTRIESKIDLLPNNTAAINALEGKIDTLPDNTAAINALDVKLDALESKLDVIESKIDAAPPNPGPTCLETCGAVLSLVTTTNILAHGGCVTESENAADIAACFAILETNSILANTNFGLCSQSCLDE